MIVYYKPAPFKVDQYLFALNPQSLKQTGIH